MINISNTLTIKLEQVLTDGEPGFSSSLDSALARPFRVLIEEGRDVGRLNHVFFTTSGHSYIFGTLCNAPSGRLIFFPGLLGRKISWDSTVSSVSNGGILDHITLEPKFRSWHLTVFVNGKKDRSHLPNRNISQIKNGLHYWFGISIQKPDLFELAVKKHSFDFQAPKNKITSYSSIIRKSKDGAIFHNLLSVDDDSLGSDEFLHFDVLIDRRFFRKFRKLPHNVGLVPFEPPALTKKEVVPLNFPMRAHPVHLPGFRGDILILVSRHRGNLVDEVLIGSAA